MRPIVLTTERLILRPTHASDIDHITAGWQNADVRRWTAVPEDATKQQAADFVNRICVDGWRENKNFILSAEVKQTREFAGCIGVTGLSWVGLAEQLAWVGYWTAQDQRRKGYTAEALQALARWAFTDLKLDRLEAIVEDGNEASLACAVKAGFRVEGKLRSRVVQNGTRRDAWAASLLPQDLGLQPSIPYETSDRPRQGAAD
ncbi:GNAT family N-acetyltransferase [Streptomyces sp. NRRL B-24720]|uniref:GNAT family N-acetyltransferase n=1 Tax=Streptomyces sp. NRRL B-24720 TaxID=1476876 RepID=UPI00055E6449|nr:GNAT family protein [Streptomyces sp. NRRL B-24720]